MAEAVKNRVTIINQKEGRIVLPPDADELKKNPNAKERVIMSGRSIEVSAEEAAKLLNHRGLMDAAKVVPSHGMQVAELKDKLAALEAENEKLRKAAPAAKKEAVAAK